MLIAVSGASGLIGSAVARGLAINHTVKTIGRHPDSDFHADFSKPETIAALNFDGVEAIIHCAGIVDEDFRENPDRAFHQAIRGTAALVKRANECSVRAIGYISSAHIYGPLAGTITESSPPNPLSDYAIAHFAAEQIMRRASNSKLCCAVFRPCAVFGIPPDLDRFRRWSLIPFAFPRDAVTSAKIALKSSGLQSRNFISAEDIARYVSAWVKDIGGAKFTAVNPIGRESLSVWDYAKMCADIYQTLTGKNCLLARTDENAPADAPLDYRSNFSTQAATDDLRSVTATLMRALLDKAAGR